MNDLKQYVSTEGLEKLKEELNYRKTILRKEIAEKIGDAKELGDLSENFEYHDAKDQQGANESRIIELENLMHNLIIVDSQTGVDTIAVGSQFKTALADGTVKKFEIVGASEADPINGKISNESPLGNKFLGLKVGEIAEIQTPGGTVTYKVVSIQ